MSKISRNELYIEISRISPPGERSELYTYYYLELLFTILSIYVILQLYYDFILHVLHYSFFYPSFYSLLENLSINTYREISYIMGYREYAPGRAQRALYHLFFYDVLPLLSFIHLFIGLLRTFQNKLYTLLYHLFFHNIIHFSFFLILL